MFKKKPIREYIGEVVYDTSLAEEVIKYKAYNLLYHRCMKHTLYKGKNKWFLVYANSISIISERQAKEILIKHNLNKCIEYFGEVEYA